MQNRLSCLTLLAAAMKKMLLKTEKLEGPAKNQLCETAELQR